MNQYICPRCGEKSYSAASYAALISKSCPYGCGGKIIEIEDAAPDVSDREAARETAFNHNLPYKGGSVNK